jgi:hypothetical protein
MEGRAAPPLEHDEAMRARFRIIDPEFFHTLRIALVAGRPFADGDADESRGVAIVSETFARRFCLAKMPSDNASARIFREATLTGIRTPRIYRCESWGSRGCARGAVRWLGRRRWRSLLRR